MTDEQIKSQIEAIERITREACKSKESATQFVKEVMAFMNSNLPEKGEKNL